MPIPRSKLGRGPRKTHIAVQENYIPQPVADDTTAPMKAQFRQNRQTMTQPVVVKPEGFPIRTPPAIPSGQQPYAPQTSRFVRLAPVIVDGKVISYDSLEPFTLPDLKAKSLPNSLPVSFQ